MKILTIVLQTCILYVFYLVGNLISEFFNLTIPGSIIGLLLLFLCLCLKIVPVKWIEDGAVFLLNILMLLFIPKTVGIMEYPSLFSFQGVLLIIVVVLSTIVSLAISGKSVQFIERTMQKRKDEKECNKHSSHSV